jgi:Ca2+-binding EF-hand superfamily protein
LRVFCSHFGSYGQTLYSRYVKQMVTAMDANADGKISRQELRTLLQNIGAMSPKDEQQQPALTDDDLQAVVEELGEESTAAAASNTVPREKEIHVDYVQDLILSVYLKENEDT